MTSYPETIARETVTLPISEKPHTVAFYYTVEFKIGEDNKPERVEKEMQLDSLTRGRGKFPGTHPEDSSAILRKLVNYRHDPEEAKKAREDAASFKKLTREQQREANKETLKAERAAKRAEKQSKEIILGADGQPLAKNSKEYRMLNGKGPEPRNRTVLGMPADASHEQYIYSNKREMLEGVVFEGEKVWMPGMTFSDESLRFQNRVSAIFRGYTIIKQGAVTREVAQVEILSGKRVEVVPVKSGGIYIRLATAPTPVFEEVTRKPRAKKETGEEVQSEEAEVTGVEVEATPEETPTTA